MIFPEVVHANFFSFIDSFVGQTASADEASSTSSTYNSVTNPFILEAANSFNPISTSSDEVLAVADETLMPSVGPAGSIADIDSQPADISPSFYVVQPKDTISLVAEMFGVSVDTIKSANNFTSSSISPGQVLVIPPISGLTYTIKKGDTIGTIVAKYKADLGDVLEYNDMPSAETSLAIGDTIFVPNVNVSVSNIPSNIIPHQKLPHDGASPLIPGYGGPVAPGPYAGGYYACPVHGSWLSQGLHGHNAVDLAIGIGNPIYAAADGTVIIARSGGWDGGYGNYIVIAHSNGTETLYAHAKKLFVKAGDVVTQGEKIAEVGVTGETTGPHLHFEVRGAANPFLTVKC